LDELPNGNARLTANRMLRVRKILTYILEKLKLDQPPIQSNNNPTNNGTVDINGNSVTEPTNANGVGSTAAATECLEKTSNGKNTEEDNNDQDNTTGNNAQNATAGEEMKNAMKPELWLELICQDQVIITFKRIFFFFLRKKKILIFCFLLNKYCLPQLHCLLLNL